jgi:hypothetical protein
MSDRPIKAALQRGLFALAALALTVAPTVAAEGWRVLQSRGTVFVLVGEKWEEVTRNQLFSGEQIVRTLPSGRLSLEGDDGRLDLGGGTAIQFSGRRITQFSGTIVATIAPGATLLIAADDALVTIRGTVELRLEGEDLSLNVISGTATLDDPSLGKAVALAAGQSVDSNAASTEQSPAKAANANASANGASNSNAAAGNAAANGNAGGNSAAAANNAGGSSAAAASNAGGNGADNGNAAGGNAGGNGADNGNAGGNGNAAGNGNGNAGGNGGNGNAGGNGNGNAGGNGNGNGN